MEWVAVGVGWVVEAVEWEEATVLVGDAGRTSALPEFLAPTFESASATQPFNSFFAVASSGRRPSPALISLTNLL